VTRKLSVSLVRFRAPTELVSSSAEVRLETPRDES
jgi:hypothetical protein